ncbi:MAG: penicillin-binding protein activator [Alphaproteobacteria bacterium]
MLVILLSVTGCAQSSAFANKHKWINPSNWFGDSTANIDASQSPDISHIKGPLTPPEAAPREPVDKAPLPQGALVPPAPLKAKVAILLPLTGKNADLGQAMLNAAQQAVFDSASNNFELMPRDTGEGEKGAEAAARDAIASGAQLLIGPLFATSIPAVRAVAQKANINMLTLSTDTSLAGPGVFVMGFAPGAQVSRIISYAATHGLKHFAALIPNTAYGSLVRQVFEKTVTQYGGTIVTIETFDPARRDSLAHIKVLATRAERFNALFLPEGGSDLTTVASQLSGNGIDSKKIRLLGTGLWDVEGLGKQSSYLASGWYAASDPSARQSFVRTYNSTYSQEPPRLATLAYDATALAAVLAKRGASFDVAELTNPNGFAGLDGIFRLTPQGLVERGLAVIEVTPDGARVIDPAPTTFAAN